MQGGREEIKIASLEPKWHKDCDDDPPARHTLLPKLLLRIVLDLLYTNSFGAQTLLPALPYLFSCVCRNVCPFRLSSKAELRCGTSVLYATPQSPKAGGHTIHSADADAQL